MRYWLCILLTLAPPEAWAQAQQVIINNGAKLQIAADQQVMFAAMQKTMQRDFKGAEALYTQAIAINNRNIDAYLQRGTVRRELGDTQGMMADGKTAAYLANDALRRDSRNAMLYYQRGMGFRLMRNYDQAEKDIRTAMAQGGNPNWQTDLKAIEFEKKAAQ